MTLVERPIPHSVTCPGGSEMSYHDQQVSRHHHTTVNFGGLGYGDDFPTGTSPEEAAQKVMEMGCGILCPIRNGVKQCVLRQAGNQITNPN